MSPQILRAARFAPVFLASSALFAGSLGIATPAQAVTGQTFSVTVNVPVPDGATSVDGMDAVAFCADPPDVEGGDTPDPDGTLYCADPEEGALSATVHDGVATIPGVRDHTAYIVNLYDDRNGAEVDSYGSRIVIDGADATVDADTFLLANRCTSIPTVAGSAALGSTLTATGAHFAYKYYDEQANDGDGDYVTGTDEDAGQITYTWEHVDPEFPQYGDTIYGSDDEPVTGDTYTVTAADQGEVVRPRATFTIGSDTYQPVECYSSNAKDIPAAVVTPDPTPAPVVIAPGTPVPGATAPAVTGKVKKGKKITAGVAVPAGATATYQWYRTFTKVVKHHKKTVTQAIPGATGPTYKLKGKDQGDKVYVVVTLTQPGYAATAVSSTPKKVK